MLVESNGLNRNSVLEQSLSKADKSLKELSNRLKKDDKLSKIYTDSIDIRNSDLSITTNVRTAEEAEILIASTKIEMENNRKQAILAHSRLSV